MKKISLKVLLCIFFPIQWLFFNWLSQHESWIEEVYIGKVFNNLSKIFRIVTGWFPFSLGLIIFYSLVIFLVYSLVKNIITIINGQQKFKSFLVNTIATLSILYGIYMITWGLAYYRKPVSIITQVDAENIGFDEIKKLVEILIIKTNQSRKMVGTQQARANNIKKYFAMAPNGYVQIANTHPELKYIHPSIKIGYSKAILSYLNTAGVYTFPTGEANLNANLTAFEAPFTICHEMAHQLGFASEEEANYISFLACMHNSEPIFKYSAYVGTMNYALNNLYSQDSTMYFKLKEKIDTVVLNDLSFARAKWKPYQVQWVNKLSSSIYDLFLRSNNQEAGIKSYGLVVELLVGEMRKNKKYLQLKPSEKF